MRSLRNTLLFTQQDMALLLGVSRSTITMYENSRRGLPPGASSMETLIAESYAAAITAQPAKHNEAQESHSLVMFKDKLLKEIAQYEHEIEVGQEKLILLQDEHLKLQVKQVTLTGLKSRLEAGASKIKQDSKEKQLLLKRIKYVEYFQGEVILMLKKCGIPARLKLQHHLDSLKAQKRTTESTLKQMDR
ncbi:helix-turn-helix domain-containing protein [Niabella hibiscisoli]|uniref:helix-turn-helix domain-containing protein n=1 Tax=Niabella hibiscisoli TaxID=1825928 RepID=UPI001F0D9E5E|nr:helix-turn-helix transcriptional regulator [Niabella hibiscisoli]MCH5719061.1 helix-turn-helix domain-containing protein [Niabella hibiscisoli]